MSEPTTRNPALTREEAVKLIEKMAADLALAMGHGGAQVNVGVQDQRFTKLISWVWATIGATAVVLGAWGVNSVNELNTKVGILISQRDRDAADIQELRNANYEIRERLLAVERVK